jgi:hypothetical protein
MKVFRPERCIVLDGKPCAACTEDIELEMEINELEKEIEKIHIRRRALRTVMNENHDSLILKFPPEIVSHIFIQYSPPNGRTDKPDGSSPLYLGAVCQKWRQLAWATPELWTSLRIAPCEEYGLSMGDLPQLASEWLERSASLSLTIRMVDCWGWVVDEDDEIINILNTHSARWRDIHFDLPARHLHRLYGSSQENILRRLVLHHPFARAQAEPADFSVFSMKSKPSPTGLTLIRVGLPYVDIVWNNLTVALVGDIGVDECFELIRRAPLLESLTLKAINPSSNVFPIPNTRLVRPHLRTLELLGIKEETVVTRILDLLYLPSLEQCNHDQSPLPMDTMISFVRSLSSCLKIFKISIDTVDYPQCPGLLFHLPSLEFLELRCTRDGPRTKELISLLCASATQSPLFLPHLQSLEFGSNWYFPWESLPQIFAQPRWQSLRVRVNTQAFPFNKILKLLWELVDQGFDLRVVQNGKDWLQKHRSG